jgi:hypothetical protein
MKDVYVSCPVLMAPDFVTFDVKLDRPLTAKRDLANGSGDVGPGEFTLDDMVAEGDRSKISPRIGIDECRQDGLGLLRMLRRSPVIQARLQVRL